VVCSCGPRGLAGGRAIGARGRCGGESCQCVPAYVRIALRAFRINELRSARGTAGLTPGGNPGGSDTREDYSRDAPRRAASDPTCRSVHAHAWPVDPVIEASDSQDALLDEGVPWSRRGREPPRDYRAHSYDPMT